MRLPQSRTKHSLAASGVSQATPVPEHLWEGEKCQPILFIHGDWGPRATPNKGLSRWVYCIPRVLKHALPTRSSLEMALSNMLEAEMLRAGAEGHPGVASPAHS